MSPEQTGRTDYRVEFKSDFYSLGMVVHGCCASIRPLLTLLLGALFYTLLMGSPPFEYQGDSLQLIHAHIARPPPNLPPSFGALVDVVNILLCKDPEQRYQSCYGLKVRRDE